MPSSLLLSIHPPSTSVDVSSITWVKAADPAPCKVTAPSCYWPRFDKSMNIYQLTWLHPASKCSRFTVSLRMLLGAATSSDYYVFSFVCFCGLNGGFDTADPTALPSLNQNSAFFFLAYFLRGISDCSLAYPVLDVPVKVTLHNLI